MLPVHNNNNLVAVKLYIDLDMILYVPKCKYI